MDLMDIYAEPALHNAVGAVQFSAPLLYASMKIRGLSTGGQFKILLLPMAVYDTQNPRVSTQAVVHTTRDLHGPGPYPENTRWGAWINSYREASRVRAQAKAARGQGEASTNEPT